MLNGIFFAGGFEAAPNSEILGTNTKSNNTYHQVLVNPATQLFKHNGVILCFEKVKRRRMTVKDSVRGYYSVVDQYTGLGIDENLDSMRSNGFSGIVYRTP